MLQDNRRSMWGNLFGYGLLDDELEKRLSEAQRKELNRGAWMDAGAALLDAGGWSPVPITTGQALGAALREGRASYAGGLQHLRANQQAAAEMAKREAEMKAEQQSQAGYEAYLATLPPEQAAMFRALGKKQAQTTLGKMAEEKAKTQTPKRSSLGQIAIDAGFEPGTPEYQKFVMQQAIKPTGTTVNVGGPGGRVGLLTPEEAAAMGLPAGTRWQYRKDGTIAPVQGTLPKDMPTDDGGMNDRQRTGIENRASAAASYAAALTGMSEEEVLNADPETLRQTIIQKGRRMFQGSVLGDIPYVSEAINRDITPYANQAASGQAAINNPTGQITEGDFAIASRQVAGPAQPIEVQADIIAKSIEEAQRIRRKANAPQRQQSDDDLIRKYLGN